jgi:hypothetical protein
MADRSVALLSGVYSTLAANAALAALLGSADRIYDAQAPADAAVPYVVIGDLTSNDYGTSSGDGQEQTLTLHVWTEEDGKKKCLDIIAAVRLALHEQSPSMSDGALVNLRCEHTETFRDQDGLSMHGVLRFRAVTTG